MYYDITLNPHLLSLVSDLDDIMSDSDRYFWEGKIVPRTNEIISAMIHKEYLVEWAAKMASVHKDYKTIRDAAAAKGTTVHQLIENTLNGKDIHLENIDVTEIRSVTNAYNSFLDWHLGLINNDNSVFCIGTELGLVCPYYGGTADAIFEINGKNILVDFKTSNHPSFQYFMQLAAYYYILTEYMNIKIDGTCVLMLSKTKREFTELPLLFDNPQHTAFLKNCLNTFFSLLYAYQNRLIIENQYNELFGGI